MAKKLGSGPTPRARVQARASSVQAPMRLRTHLSFHQKPRLGPETQQSFKNVISLCTQRCKRIDSVPLHLLQPVHFQATKTALNSSGAGRSFMRPQKSGHTRLPRA